MIASWMVYALLVSALITIAALALERVAGSLRRPLRFVWLGAVVLSIAWPVGNELRRLLPQRPVPARVLPFTITVAPTRIMSAVAPGSSRAEAIDRALIVVWCALSALLLLRLTAGVVSLERTRRHWKRARVDGMPVRLSENVGPAVVGLRSMDVVLPEWIMTLDAPLRAIVLRHEEEHRSARDPYLLFAAAISVVAMPWNPALWFQARRLRLAIEMDCDARVLRAHPSPERYGLLMLTIAQRRAVAPTLFAPMLSEPTSHLERRILAMRNTTKKVARLTMYAGTGVAIAVLALAGTLQSAPAAPIAAALRTAPVSARQAGNPAPVYPEMLRRAEIEGTVVVTAYSTATGALDMGSLRIESTSHDLFTNAVRQALKSWHVAPNAAANLAFAFVMADKGGAALQASGGGLTLRVNGIDATVIVGRPESGTLNDVVVTARPEAVPAPAPPSGPEPMRDGQVYFEFQVEHQVTPRPGNFGPRYPDTLRAANVEGEVLVQFVVDRTGAPEMESFKTLKSTHQLFTDAVLTVLPTMRFNPAQVGGQPVRQLVQVPFQFSLSR